MKTIPTYKIVPAKLSPNKMLRSNDEHETTLNGTSLTVRVPTIFISLQDNDRDATNPFVVQPSVGGRLANGYAHGISAVLRPIDLQPTGDRGSISPKYFLDLG